MKIRVVLVEPEGSVNLGFIARTCMNFGVSELYLVNPKASIEEALNYVAKAKDMLLNAVIVDSIDKAVKDVELIIATTARGYSPKDYVRQAVPLREFVENMLTGKEYIAILFGRESTGLTREELLKADVLVTIPADPKYPVLNLSQSVAIVLYELWMKERYGLSENIPPLASREELELIMKLFDDIIKRLEIHENKATRIRRIIHSIIFRSRLSVDEAKTLEYLLRKVIRRLEK